MDRKTIVSKEIKLFGKLVKERRCENQMNDENLAEACNRSNRNIRDIGSGKREPKLSTALLICKTCEIHTGKLGQFVPQEEIAYV